MDAPPDVADATVPSMLDDCALVDAGALGDLDAFETLVLRHGPALHRYARRMLRDAGDVEDVVQDTFVAAWRQLGSFRGESSVQTWFFAICSRKIVDAHRFKRAQPVDDGFLESLTPSARCEDPFLSASNAHFMSALEAALDDLPSRQRATWVLREIEAMSFVDIGAVLTLSPDCARGHHRRARATLSERLTRWQ
ncbi:sigma-70 family RNA polymerase sigma factor [Mycobacterium yunnanensis]|uniref:RNA polymerase sigma factor n=2 Tax=Mycobacterium yunnanensis TaxID=368477 RepID=A0A9X2YZW9_9MYCO|nr:sigma-70 family RNA polymerase sigma factor [Mycobacterium yunnanensis]